MSAAAKSAPAASTAGVVSTAPISNQPQVPITIPGNDSKTAAAGSGGADTKHEFRQLFPADACKPYKTGRLKVSDEHEIYYEFVGNPKGKPLVFLHGGPGGGIAGYYRQYYDPAVWNVLLFDQRGSGQSTPFASLSHNTTWDLVADIEKLRVMAGWESFVVFGGSWGSTLALAYAQTHPTRVKALVLRGIFALRESELKWFYQEGASWLFPDAWEKFVEPIPLVERGHLMSAYHRRLTGSDETEKLKCAKAWSVWEMHTSRLYVDPAYIARAADDDKFALAFARIENHYFVNGGFLATDNQLVDGGAKLETAKIPGTIVQGRYDLVCPMKTAWDLHKTWPKADFVIVPDAGHSIKEPGVTDALIRAVEKYAHL